MRPNAEGSPSVTKETTSQGRHGSLERYVNVQQRENTFPKKANPFFSHDILVFGGVASWRHLQMLKYFHFTLVFGGVGTLPHLQSILMNVF